MQCRICFEETENRASLIVPCRCSGSSKYVHRACLDQWRMMNPDGLNYSRCSTCHHTFELEAVMGETQRLSKLRLIMIWEQIVIGIVIVLIVAVGILVTYMWNRYKKSRTPRWSILAMGLLVGLGLVGLCELMVNNIELTVPVSTVIFITVIPNATLMLLAVVGVYRICTTSQSRYMEKEKYHRARLWPSTPNGAQPVRDYGEAGPL